MKTLIRIVEKATILSLVMVMVLCSTAFGQTNVADYKTYKGVVKDSKTNTVIAFASVYVTGASIGTVTNSEGEFTLKIKNDLPVESIEISHLGFKTKKVDIKTLTANTNEILMESVTFTLKEIKVKTYDATQLLEEMMAKVSENYGTKPNMMTGFYREAIKKKSNYIYISEAIVDIYKAAYTSDLDNDNVKIFKGRKSQRAKGEDTIMVKMRGGPSIALLMDIIKNPYVLFDKDEIANYEFSMGDMQVIDDKPIYVLKFNQKYSPEKALYNGSLYINSETLALTAAEFSLNIENIDAATRMFIQHKPVGLRFEPVNTKYFIKYKEENGKYYYNYARYELNFTCDWKKRVFKSKYDIMAEIAITDRDSVNIEKIQRKDRIYPTEVFSDKVSAFVDTNFWGSENFIEPDRSIEESLAKYAKWLKKNTHN